MRTAVGLCMAAVLVLAACSTRPQRDSAYLYEDALFVPPPAAVPQPADLMALTPAMRAFLEGPIAEHVRRSGSRMGLYEALRNELHIEYDAAVTRTPAQAFDARSGNCLSLVMLTAAFAHALNVRVEYQSVYGYEAWSRASGIAFRSGHVNLVLGPRVSRGSMGRIDELPLTVDFYPADEVARQVAREIPENTVVAMFMNNRAAESIAAGDLDGAYAWVRAALRTDPSFLTSYNTLGVVYLHHDNLLQSERALRYALEVQPENAEALTNLVHVLTAQNRDAEAEAARQQLARVVPYPPFYFFDQGMAALERGEPKPALSMFERELSRMPYSDELHFAMAIAHLELGEVRRARREMALALENSTTLDHRALYQAQLNQLNGIQVH